MPDFANKENMVLQTRPGGTKSSLPPVIVLNLFYSGLGIARQLRGTGVRVLGFSAHPRIYGSFTRLCEVRPAPHSLEQPQELADFLLNAATELRGAVIFPTCDADVIFLDRFRNDLEPLYRLAIPSNQVLRRVLDKSALVEIAFRAGIPVPRTAVARHASQLRPAVETVGLPCVVKPTRSLGWREGNNWRLVGARKAFRVDDLATLQREYQQVSQACPEILLQEWIPGRTDDIVVWGGYISRRRELLTYFTAKKIVQSPAEFGNGCVVESTPLLELLEPSSRLYGALGYEGIAEIEYKRDARDGQLKLIEINPRHWDWHELGRANQVNLTWAAYCDLTAREIQPVMPTPQSTKWVAEDALVMHILSDIFHKKPGVLRYLKHIAGKKIYGIFSWNDPMPLLRYAVTCMAPKLAGALITKIRRHWMDQSIAMPVKA
jgi:predicted ATP-grasp superfamily ATP-dependent carboligase